MLKAKYNVPADEIKVGDYLEVGQQAFVVINVKSDYDGNTKIKLTTKEVSLVYITVEFQSAYRTTIYVEKN